MIQIQVSYHCMLFLAFQLAGYHKWISWYDNILADIEKSVLRVMIYAQNIWNIFNFFHILIWLEFSHLWLAHCVTQMQASSAEDYSTCAPQCTSHHWHVLLRAQIANKHDHKPFLELNSVLRKRWSSNMAIVKLCSVSRVVLVLVVYWVGTWECS